MAEHMKKRRVLWRQPPDLVNEGPIGDSGQQSLESAHDCKYLGIEVEVCFTEGFPNPQKVFGNSFRG